MNTDNQIPHGLLTASNSSSSSSYPQTVSFKPANGSNVSLTDLVDLNELFADDFEFPKYNYEDYPTNMPPGMDVEQFADFTPSYDQISLSSISPNFSFSATNSVVGYNMQDINSRLNDRMVKGRNNVIMIPPTMPRPNIPMIPNIKAEGSKLKGKGDGKRPLDASDDPKSAKNIKSSSQSSADNQPRGDDKDSVETQKVERRERNREHAKKSRIRKKLLLDSLQDQLAELRNENMNLRRVVSERIPQLAAKILLDCTTSESQLLAQWNSDDEDEVIDNIKPSPLTSNIAQNVINNVQLHSQNSSQKKQHLKQTAKILMEPDYRLMQSLVTSQQNFVLSDPSLPDNPIVYASDGFCKMTGYKRHEVLGRNCRFLQGPLTDQAAVDIIRQGIVEGRDISVCLLNYKADGVPFWNQFFLAALRDADGQIVNYVGVQCEVNNIPVNEIKDRVKKLPIPNEM